MRTWFLESFDLASWTCPDGKFVVFRAREPYDVRAKVQIANLGKHSMSFWKKLFGAKDPPTGNSAKRRPPALRHFSFSASFHPANNRYGQTALDMAKEEQGKFVSRSFDGLQYAAVVQLRTGN